MTSTAVNNTTVNNTSATGKISHGHSIRRHAVVAMTVPTALPVSLSYAFDPVRRIRLDTDAVMLSVTVVMDLAVALSLLNTGPK